MVTIAVSEELREIEELRNEFLDISPVRTKDVVPCVGHREELSISMVKPVQEWEEEEEEKEEEEGGGGEKEENNERMKILQTC